MEKLLFRVARRWIAGYDQQAALATAKDANTRGLRAILNFLGEDTTNPGNVESTAAEYLTLMDAINSHSISGCVSIKPTQLGLAISYEECLRNYRTMIARAKALSQFVWVDMESIRFTEDTISIYLELLNEYPKVGIAIQAYLRRSASDILHIVEHGGKIRLVKGAYHEPEEQAFVTREQVDANYSKLMEMLFESASDFAIATHDSKLIAGALMFSSKNPRARFEFQMLMGIRDDLKPQLIKDGHTLSEYIPYGSQWLPYSVRRLRERKRNILLLARSIVNT